MVLSKITTAAGGPSESSNLVAPSSVMVKSKGVGKEKVLTVQQGGNVSILDSACGGNITLVSDGSHSQRGDNIGKQSPVCESFDGTGVVFSKITTAAGGPSEPSNLVAPSSVMGKSKGVGKENVLTVQQGGNVSILQPKTGTWKKKARGTGGTSLVEKRSVSVYGRRKAEDLCLIGEQPQNQKRGRLVTVMGILEDDNSVAVAAQPRQSP
jgi:hypothetical protein